MKELQAKQRNKRLLYSIPSLALLTLISFLLVKGAFGILMKERESARLVRELEEKVVAGEKREKELEIAVSRLQTEEGLIDEIKSKFSVTREGEHVAVIVDERSKVPETDASEEGWFGNLWQKVKSLWAEEPSGYNAEHNEKQ